MNKENSNEVSKKELDYIFKIFEEGYMEGYKDATESLIAKMTGLHQITLPKTFQPLSCNDREFLYYTLRDYLNGKNLDYAKHFKMIAKNILMSRKTFNSKKR